MVAAALFCLAVTGSPTAQESTSVGGVPAPMMNSLSRGVNITRWFCYLSPGDQTNHFKTYFLDADYANLKKLKVTYVRLCISPDAIYTDGSYSPTVMPQLDASVTQLIKHGLTVIWDLHDNGQLALDQVKGDRTGFTHFWSGVAQHYKGKWENRMVFELLNEPQFQKNPQDWYALQNSTVGAIRQADPLRTVLVSSTSWSSIDTLATMSPLPEKNLLYTFHCYDPFFFTHQGAEWVGEYPGHFKAVPFPSSPEAVSAILNQNDPKYWPALREYGAAHYDDESLRNRLSKAMEWGVAHEVPLVLGEFGAYPKVSPPESRARWFDAMRGAIDLTAVSAAIWGYDDGLGLGRRVQNDGTIWLDPVTLKSFYREP